MLTPARAEEQLARVAVDEAVRFNTPLAGFLPVAIETGELAHSMKLYRW